MKINPTLTFKYVKTVKAKIIYSFRIMLYCFPYNLSVPKTGMLSQKSNKTLKLNSILPKGIFIEI